MSRPYDIELEGDDAALDADADSEADVREPSPSAIEPRDPLGEQADTDEQTGPLDHEAECRNVLDSYAPEERAQYQADGARLLATGASHDAIYDFSHWAMAARGAKPEDFAPGSVVAVHRYNIELGRRFQGPALELAKSGLNYMYVRAFAAGCAAPALSH